MGHPNKHTGSCGMKSKRMGKMRMYIIDFYVTKIQMFSEKFPAGIELGLQPNHQDHRPGTVLPRYLSCYILYVYFYVTD